MPRKILVVGDAGVGKTQLVQVGFNNKPPKRNGKATIGADFVLINFEDEQDNVAIWDVAGQERFGLMLEKYFRDTALILLVVDLTDQKSMINIEKWHDALMRTNKDLSNNIVKVLVGHKSDLKDSRQVQIEALKHLATTKELNFDPDVCITSIYDSETLKEFAQYVYEKLPVLRISPTATASSPAKKLPLLTSGVPEAQRGCWGAFFSWFGCCSKTTVDEGADESLTSSSSNPPRFDYGSSGYF